jgi:hypothetical protein
VSYAAQVDADLKSLQERIKQYVGSSTAPASDPTVLKFATVVGYAIAASTFGDHLEFLQEQFGSSSMSTTTLVVLVGDVDSKVVPLAVARPCNSLVSVAAQLAVVATAGGAADSCIVGHLPLLCPTWTSSRWEECSGSGLQTHGLDGARIGSRVFLNKLHA